MQNLIFLPFTPNQHIILIFALSFSQEVRMIGHMKTSHVSYLQLLVVFHCVNAPSFFLSSPLLMGIWVALILLL